MGSLWDFLNDTERCEVKPDAIAFNCVLDVCVKAGDIQRARQLVQEMKEIQGWNQKVTREAGVIIRFCPGHKEGGGSLVHIKFSRLSTSKVLACTFGHFG